MQRHAAVARVTLFGLPTQASIWSEMWWRLQRRLQWGVVVAHSSCSLQDSNARVSQACVAGQGSVALGMKVQGAQQQLMDSRERADLRPEK